MAKWKKEAILACGQCTIRLIYQKKNPLSEKVDKYSSDSIVQWLDCK